MKVESFENRSEAPISEMVDFDFDLSYPTYLKEVATLKIQE